MCSYLMLNEAARLIIRLEKVWLSQTTLVALDTTPHNKINSCFVALTLDSHANCTKVFSLSNFPGGRLSSIQRLSTLSTRYLTTSEGQINFSLAISNPRYVNNLANTSRVFLYSDSFEPLTQNCPDSQQHL